MSGDKYIKQAIVAALCEHPEAEKYKNKAFEGENLSKMMQALSSKTNELTKADFFQLDDDGKSLIDTPGFWRNLDKIADILAQHGEAFGFQDFVKPIMPRADRTLMDSARQNSAYSKIFTFKVWQGRFDEMERLWYKVPVPLRRDLFHRDGLIDLNLKRSLLRAEGRTMPEDRLAEAGISMREFFDMFAMRGNYEEIQRKLAAKGDYLRKEYLLLTDSNGDTVFKTEAAWERYNDIFAHLKKHNDIFDTVDFTRQVSTVNNILTRAAEKKALHHIFNPAHWENRLPKMLELWGEVLDGWKISPMTVNDFDNAYAEAENATYGGRLAFNLAAAAQDLFKPVNGAALMGQEKAVLPLGLKSVWNNIDTIIDAMSTSGRKITLAELRRPSGERGYSCLMTGAKCGHFAKISKIMRMNGERLEVSDFLQQDKHGNSLLNILADRNQLALVFMPDVWAGRVSEMKDLWGHVRKADEHQVDIRQAEIAAKQATLKQQAPRNKFQIPKGPQ